MSNQTVTFQKALDAVESLPEYQQENLVETVRHRMIEQRRDVLAKNIRDAKKEYSRGEIKRGNVDDLMRELSK
ncbi:MAG: hypothetical protein COS41_04665 [Elusimicrobia bacterium CG03_land_8_20_14_0_80_50_18]|nr:MAG: hypothetical protein COS41_04665 [Elusimicrobia bacterium CG03_land_8_20_14_0_80_50_18]